MNKVIIKLKEKEIKRNKKIMTHFVIIRHLKCLMVFTVAKKE